jgi:uncharacterized 2Fe-2S/4Fe-4S cluster protein (DUF4445 family)
MTEKAHVELSPLGVAFDTDVGSSLETALAPYGIEFPCGGGGSCRGCRVRVIKGTVAIRPAMRRAFTPDELAAGWRLACRARVEGPLTLEVAQWTSPVLGDDSRLVVEPADGTGIAIDLGTTTLVVQLVELSSGKVLAVKTALNPQTAHGADLMSRISFALAGGSQVLAGAIRNTLGEMIAELPERDSVRTVMLVGNTVMHHLFCGIDVKPLGYFPFLPLHDGEQVFGPGELGWDLPQRAKVHFLPCLGGLVGSDVLAGVVAAGLADKDALCALIDLGTNGEIVVGNSERLLCASTAAGPAFEGGRIRMGMRAATGAVARVAVRDGRPGCRVLGGGEARGICGSGLVDAAAVGLELGAIAANGRLTGGAKDFPLLAGVSINQADIRELQLAKAAIAAGLRILTEHWGATLGELDAVYLAGAFGNYLNVASARRIGLIEVEPARVKPVGNTALRGVKMHLLTPSQRHDRIAGIRARTEHLSLAADPRFEEIFVDCLAFPKSWQAAEEPLAVPKVG